jgi:hypothetical protein
MSWIFGLTFELLFSAIIVSMFRHRPNQAALAVFVLLFVCLNAGGAVCVAYCNKFIESGKAEHCPLSKNGKHCDREKNTQHESGKAVDGKGMDCCPMTVSFIAGPLEKHSFAFDDSAAPVVEKQLALPIAAFHVTVFPTGHNYRGPPFDRRTDRIKHCLIRI